MCHAKDNVIDFMWKLSHVGILKYEHADRLARSAYAKPSVDTDLEMPFAMTSREQSSCKGNLSNRMNIKGPKVAFATKIIFRSYKMRCFHGGN